MNFKLKNSFMMWNNILTRNINRKVLKEVSWEVLVVSDIEMNGLIKYVYVTTYIREDFKENIINNS